ncbi:MAG: DUF4372 domain-containing protein [Mangrovibacterium sp.]
MFSWFGQLDGCNSLRELTDITTAHARKSFHLGFGRTPINRTQLSKVNQIRGYRIFEEFAYHMVVFIRIFGYVPPSGKVFIRFP